MKLLVQMSTRVPWPLALGNEKCGFRESEWCVGPSKGILPFLTWSPKDLTSFKGSFSRFKQFEHHRNPLQIAEAAQCRCWESCPRQLAGRSLASLLLVGNLHWNTGMTPTPTSNHIRIDAQWHPVHSKFNVLVASLSSSLLGFLVSLINAVFHLSQTPLHFLNVYPCRSSSPHSRWWISLFIAKRSGEGGIIIKDIYDEIQF